MTTSPIQLPSAEAFAQLPLLQRARLFGDWLKAQPREGTYDWNDRDRCALSRFSQAIHRSETAVGISCTIAAADNVSRNTEVEVFPGGVYGRCADVVGIGSAHPERMVFGEVSDAYEAALAVEVAAVLAR